MQQSPQCLCAQLALACQALCVSNPNRHDTQNQSTYLAEGCIPLKVRPFPCIAYKTSFKTALAPPALLSSIPAGAITKKHPSDRRGCLHSFFRLQLAATWPLSLRPHRGTDHCLWQWWKPQSHSLQVRATSRFRSLLQRQPQVAPNCPGWTDPIRPTQYSEW